MPGNTLAQAAMNDAAARNKTPKQVYDTHAAAFIGLPDAKKAFCEGYLSCLVGHGINANPYVAVNGDLLDEWRTGWLNGQNGDFGGLATRIHVMKGGD